MSLQPAEPGTAPLRAGRRAPAPASRRVLREAVRVGPLLVVHQLSRLLGGRDVDLALHHARQLLVVHG